MMLALTKDSTSIYFGCKHMCTKHASPITLEHIKTCDLFQGYGTLKDFVLRVKSQNIRDWPRPEQDEALMLFKALAEQILAMEQAGYAKFQQRQQAAPLVGPKRPRGRPKKTQQPSVEGITKYF